MASLSDFQEAMQSHFDEHETWTFDDDLNDLEVEFNLSKSNNGFTLYADTYDVNQKESFDNLDNAAKKIWNSYIPLRRNDTIRNFYGHEPSIEELAERLMNSF